MATDPTNPSSYSFGDFRIDAVERVLMRKGELVPLTPKVFDLLLLLVENHGHVVEKERLMKEVWPDAFVEEGNLTQNISVLRKALGNSINGNQYIQTIPRRGYRFVGSVSIADGSNEELVVEELSRARIIVDESDHHTKLPDWPAALPAAPKNRTRRIVLAAGGGLCLLLLAGLGLNFLRKPPSPAPSAQINTIAVLPLKSLGQSGEDQYLQLGIADDLISKLSNMKEIVVRPTGAVRQYSDPQQDPIAAGKALKVDAVVEGNIQQLGDRIRVTARLVQVSDGHALWSGSFDEKMSDVFAVEDSISQRVAEAIVPELSGTERKLLARHQTDNPEAHQAYLRGRFFWNKRTVEGINKAIEFFQKAIEIEPNYALAYVRLADCYAISPEYMGRPATKMLPIAKGYVEHALELDDSLAEAHASLGSINHGLWHFAEAEKEFKKSLALNPNYPTAHHWYSFLLVVLGRREESLAEIKRAQELDPLSPIIADDLLIIYFLQGDYRAADAEAARVIEISPNFPDAHLQLGKVYLAEGRYPEAEAEFQKGVDLSNRGASYLPYLAYAAALQGKRGQAAGLAKELEDKYSKGEAQGYELAILYAGMGDRDRALAWLEKNFQTGGSQLTTITVEPVFDSLRNDPRFTSLLQRMGMTH